MHEHQSRRRAPHDGASATGGSRSLRARACRGWTITADLGTVTLRQLHEVLGEPAIFAIGNRNETPDCLVEQSVNAALDAAFADAEALLLERFAHVTLADLAADFARRHAERRIKRNK